MGTSLTGGSSKAATHLLSGLFSLVCWLSFMTAVFVGYRSHVLDICMTDVCADSFLFHPLVFSSFVLEKETENIGGSQFVKPLA